MWALQPALSRAWEWIAWHNQSEKILVSPRSVVLPDYFNGQKEECRFQLSNPDVVADFRSVIDFDVEEVIREYLQELYMDKDFVWYRRIRQARFNST